MSLLSYSSIRRNIETTAVWLILNLFRLLSVDTASAFGGVLARIVGPRLSVSQYARRNLKIAFPEYSLEETEKTVRMMWDNLGRVFAEYAHLDQFKCYESGGRVEVIGTEYLDDIRERGTGALFFSAHLGNWEIAPIGANQRGLSLLQIYRPANNVAVDGLIARARKSVGGTFQPKGRRGAREASAALARGEYVAMLVDQKLGEGIAVPFFGRPAMTAPALASLALRHRCPIVPARVERLIGATFRLTVYAPMELPNSGNRGDDSKAIMADVNKTIEAWVRSRPDQWLWLHRRGPDSD